MPDDSNEIVEKLVYADIIVFGSPVYWWGISAQLKLLVDKLYCNQMALKHKRIGLVVVGAEAVDDKEYKLISEQFKCISNFLDWEILFDEKAAACTRGEVKNNQVIMEKLYKIGNNL